MKIDSDDFELFGLPQQFALETDAVDSRWRALQAEVHPDRFVSMGVASQRTAMQWAVRVDEGHRRLRDPVRRAAYLCELAGTPVDAERNTVMPLGFLQHQMAWREALDDAATPAELQALEDEVGRYRHNALAQLEQTIDRNKDWTGAAQAVRSLMFVERFASDIDHRMEALEQ